MGNPNYSNDEMTPGYPNIGMGDEQGMQGDDIEIDNRIKELLLSTHNLYLIGQMHEKEIKDLGPVIKDLPQLIGGVLRSVGELGGIAGEGEAKAGGAGLSTGTLLAACAGTAVAASILTVALIKFLVV